MWFECVCVCWIWISYWLRNYIANISLFMRVSNRMKEQKKETQFNTKRLKSVKNCVIKYIFICYVFFPRSVFLLIGAMRISGISVPFFQTIWYLFFTYSFVAMIGLNFSFPLKRQVSCFECATPLNQTIFTNPNAVIIYQFMYLLHC